MLKLFGEAVVRAFGHTYTLDLSPLNGVAQTIAVVCLIAVIAIGFLVRQFTAKSLGYTALGSSLLLLWAGLFFRHERALFGLWHSEGHIFNLFASDFRPFQSYFALMTGLCAVAAVAFIQTRPPDLLQKPFAEQVQAMWWRVMMSLFLVGIWWWGFSSGLHTVRQFAMLGHVPSLEFPVHHVVQVGLPFAMKPSGGRYVGAFESHWFREATPRRISQADFQQWSLPEGPYRAEHTGQNDYPFRMTRTGPLRFSVETVFHVEATKEHGSPLFPLRVGDTWTYRRGGPVRNKQQLLQQFRKNTPPLPPKTNVKGVTPESPPAVVRVANSRIEDGVRIFEVTVSNPYAEKSFQREQTYFAVMMDGETFQIPGLGSDAFDRHSWQPILSKVDSPAPKGEKLYPCVLRILAVRGECLCNDAPLDEKRQLPGLSRCVESNYTSHSGENALMLGLALFSLGTIPFHERSSTESHIGLLLEESANRP